MPRPKKTKIDLTPESFVTLLQEIYNDCNEQKRKALEELSRRNKEFESETVQDEQAISKANNDSLKIIDNAISKKLELAKLQGQTIAKSGVSDSETESGSLTPEDIRILRESMSASGDNHREIKL